jgi:hypothetical protein
MFNLSKMFILILLLSLVICEITVYAQDKQPSGLGWGLRGGISLDPDQIVFGAQYSLGKKFKITRLVPSVDLGLGDNVTTLDINGDLLLRMLIQDIKFRLYGGGGPTLAFWDFEGGSEWKLGLSLVIGTQIHILKKNATNVEARFGIGDIPDFRLLLAVIL